MWSEGTSDENEIMVVVVAFGGPVAFRLRRSRLRGRRQQLQLAQVV